MIITLTVDHKKITTSIKPNDTLRMLLVAHNFISVRDSDDNEGFAGSDTVIFNGKPIYANLMLAALADNSEVLTAHSLSKLGNLSIVQEAMIDSGVVQSAYNAPAAALLLTWLLEHNPNPSREDVKEVLSGIFIRDTGYEHYFIAVQLAVEKMRDGKYSTPIAPEFREHLDYIGKVKPKVDGRQLVAGWKSFVEDRVEPNAASLIMLRSPHAHAYINKIDTSEAEKIPGVITIITAFNCPDVYYMSAGQGNPEPSPYDRRLFNKKVRHVGDRVAAIVARSEAIAKEAREKIKVEYEVLAPIFTVEEAMAEGAPVVQNGVAEYLSGAPDNLSEYNKGVDEREGKIIYPFPLHANNRKNVAAAAHGSIGDVEKGFSEADVVIERTYQSSQIQCTPLEPHLVFSKMDNDRLVVHASTQVPFHLRRIVAKVCQIPENKVHIVKEKVGGGYGSKQDILVEDVVAYATYITREAIYYRNTREEEFIANSTRHPMRVT
ncbi:MAG: molybdopterin-dependent oxidoreductase Mo/Fe-S-binding subunit, partial [Spirochaetia bacterium]|nr:molybdopterin-dependent oxidoreductase Mo/Fe-S-binding subunit [Spirochaetia bacterium]